MDAKINGLIFKLDICIVTKYLLQDTYYLQMEKYQLYSGEIQ